MAISNIFTYNPLSEGSKELAKELGVARIKHQGSSFKGAASKVVLNWGASSEKLTNSEIRKCTILNPPNLVDIACDKLASFERFKAHGVSHPDFTTSRAQATEWLTNGDTVFARTQLRASSGRGIQIMDPDHPDTWEVTANLYVKYVPKKDEYRVHVVNGEVIDVQRKGLREEFKNSEGVNWKVRNLANGFVFVRNDGKVAPACVLDVGKKAVQALDLTFGAADVIYNQKANRAYILEVNTAPGLQGTTVINYANAFRKM